MFIKISVILNPEKLLNLFLLLAWSTVRGVCPNHEVVMFRHRTLTPLYLGFFINCYVATPFFLTRSTLLRPPPDFPLGGVPAPASIHSPVYPSCIHTGSFSHMGVTCLCPSIPIPIAPWPILWLIWVHVSSSTVATSAVFPTPIPCHRQNLF